MADIYAVERSSGLPSLSAVIQRYPRSTPKRYEDTRSAIIQDFTHQRILGYGSEIHRKTQEQQEQEKLQSVRQSEEEVWHQAKIIKIEELKKQKDHLRIEHEKTIARLYKEFEKTVKEETLKVEMQMQKLAIDQVVEERAKGELALSEAVKQAEVVAASEKREACSAVRAHERKVAEAFVTNLMEKHTKEVSRIHAAASAEKKEALSKLEETKEHEKNEAVQAARLQEQAIAAINLDKCKRHYETELQKMEVKISEKCREIECLIQDIQKIEYIKKAVEKSLLDTRQDYLNYLERTSCLNKEQTELFMPSLYLEDVEKKARLEYEKTHQTHITPIPYY